MTDRPIIFSRPMVRSLLYGSKTQTRRLATSPLRNCEPGDRLYVRENGNWTMGTEIAPVAGQKRGIVWYEAGSEDRSALSMFGGKMRPCIHMPRWASRLTLIVEGVRIEALHTITDKDAEAEGVEMESADPPFWYVPGIDTQHVHALPEKGEGPRECYFRLWNHLHGAGSFEANPQVLVLTFSVVKENIDRISA